MSLAEKPESLNADIDRLIAEDKHIFDALHSKQ
jgi:hypothetical protein